MSKIRALLALLSLLASVTAAAHAAPLIESPVPDAQQPSPFIYQAAMPQVFERVTVTAAKPKPKPKPAVATRPLRPMRVMATAYALNGRTAGGTRTAMGTIAVDPRLIPLGTRLYVPGYGWGKALDTGGAIKGNVIDLWMPSVRDCFAWGVRTVQIMVEAPEPPQHKRQELASRSGRRPVRKR